MDGRLPHQTWRALSRDAQRDLQGSNQLRPRVRLERWQVISNPLSLPLAREFGEQFTGLLHVRINDFLVRADSQEAEFRKRTQDDAFTIEPGKRLTVSGMIGPNGG